MTKLLIVPLMVGLAACMLQDTPVETKAEPSHTRQQIFENKIT